MPLLSQTLDFSAANHAFADMDAPTAALFSDLLATTCRDNAPMRQALPVARVRQLIACCAWNDAALALLALKLPQWQLRRLVYDDGEWHCALSRHRDMPEWLDDAIEVHHANMALAILGAVVEAARQDKPHRLTSVPASYQADVSFEPMLSDNFA